jgi:cytochrome c553
MWIKRAGIALGIALALVMVVLTTVYGVSEARFRHTYQVADENIGVTNDSAAIARGAHLATTIGCVECHGEGLRGAAVIDAPPMGRIVALNLTRGKGGVGALMTPAVVERAVRHGIGPDNRALRIMPSNNFQWLSDDDMRAIVAYVTQLPPVDNELSPTRLMLLPRALLTARLMPLLPAEHMDGSARPMTVPPGPTVEYGHYIATIGGCTDCHGAGLSGGKISTGDPAWPPAANLTRTGNLGKWNESQFVSLLRTGVRPDGIPLKAPMSAAPKMFGRMTDPELHALWLYLQSVPPRAYGNH